MTTQEDREWAEQYAIWPFGQIEKVRYAKTRIGMEWLMFWGRLRSGQRMVCRYPIPREAIEAGEHLAN